MDEGTQDPTENGNRDSHIVLAFVIAGIVLIFDTGEFLKAIDLKVVASPSIFSIPSEIFSRFDSCDYSYLFACDVKPADYKCYRESPRDPQERGVCIAVVNSFQPDVAPSFANRLASIPYLKIVLFPW